jgi:hypothetical protein
MLHCLDLSFAQAVIMGVPDLTWGHAIARKAQGHREAIAANPATYPTAMTGWISLRRSIPPGFNRSLHIDSTFHKSPIGDHPPRCH